MMAASVVRNGIAGLNTDSHSAIPPSQHSSSMHESESSVTPPSPASSTTTISSPPVVNSNEDQEEGKSGSNDQLSSISPAGKKLAVPSVQGPSASLVSSNSLIHEDETNIALSQLKELEVAIEVRKVNRVDGRKTRWIEYRREKEADIQAKLKSKSKGISIKEKSPPKTGVVKVKKPVKVKVSKAKRHTAENIKDDKVVKPLVNGDPVEEIKDTKPEIKEKISEITNNNNNNIDNNNKKIENNMKVEISGPLISTLGTNNVLETMKQHFLQGTIDVPQHTSNGLRDKPSRKLSKSTNGASTPPNHINNENFKRKPGRPKKIDNAKGTIPAKLNNLNVKPETPLSSQSVSVGAIPSLNTSPDDLSIVNKKVDLPPLTQSTTDFYARRNLLTKGLREVRKSESGSESGGSSPIKDGSPSLSPSPQLALSPISPLTPLVTESSNATNSNSLKCPLITTAAKVLTTGAKKSKINVLTTKRKKGLKLSKKENINLIQEANGHASIPNGSANKDGKSGSAKIPKSLPVLKKRGRGRKPKCKTKEVPQKWAKTTSTVIVDVHNTMNGEPQTVIPVQNPILLRTKKSLTPPKLHKSILESPKEVDGKCDSKDTLLESSKLSSNKQKEIVPPVPELVNTSPLISRSSSPSFTSKKLTNNSESASKVSQNFESGKNDSTKIKNETNADDLSKVKKVPEILTPVNLVLSVDIEDNAPEKVEEVLIKNNKNLSEKSISTFSPEIEVIGEKAAPKLSLTDICQLKVGEKGERIKDLKQIDLKKNVNILPVDPLNKTKVNKDFVPPSTSSITNKFNSQQSSFCTADKIEKSNFEEIEKEEKLNNFEPLKNVSTTKVSSYDVIDIDINSPTKLFQVDMSKGSFANKVKKTPEKIKNNKSLNAVLEKLYSPTAKKVSDNEEKISDSINKESVTPVSPSDDIIEVTLSDPLAITGNEILESSALYQDSIEYECNLHSKVIEKEEIQVEKKKTKAQQSTMTVNSDKVPSVSGKPKEKVPRFLKQLFQDEGVQNMLRSVNEETVTNGEGNVGIDFSSHKLRPKRAHENFASESPEPDDSLLVLNSKRKKRGIEGDNGYVEEGTLSNSQNFENSRKSSVVDDAASDSSQGSGSKSSNSNAKTLKGQPEAAAILPDVPRKRKLSEISSMPGIIVGKVLHQQEREVKRVKLDAPKLDVSSNIQLQTENNVSEEPNSIAAAERQKKKPGRPSLPVPLKQTTKAQVVFQYRKQLSNLGISSEGMSVAQMRERLNKAKGHQKAVKSVPPIRIRLPSGQEKMVKHVPHSHESLNRHPAGHERQTKALHNTEKRMEFQKGPEFNHSLNSSSGLAPSPSMPKVPRTSTPTSISSSNIVRTHPPDRPKTYDTQDDHRPSLKYAAASGLPRKAASFTNSLQTQSKLPLFSCSLFDFIKRILLLLRRLISLHPCSIPLEFL